jgi:hypothetical protein
MNNKNQMFRKIENTKLAIASFIARHPKVVMYGISLGLALGIGFVLSSLGAPHDAFAIRKWP